MCCTVWDFGNLPFALPLSRRDSADNSCHASQHSSNGDAEPGDLAMDLSSGDDDADPWGSWTFSRSATPDRDHNNSDSDSDSEVPLARSQATAGPPDSDSDDEDEDPGIDITHDPLFRARDDMFCDVGQQNTLVLPLTDLAVQLISASRHGATNALATPLSLMLRSSQATLH